MVQLLLVSSRRLARQVAYDVDDPEQAGHDGW